MFALQLSRTAQKALDKLPPNATKKIFIHLEEIKRDPYRPRPLADIVPVGGSDTHYRLRVGKLRIEYEVFNSVNTKKYLKYFKRKENLITDKAIY